MGFLQKFKDYINVPNTDFEDDEYGEEEEVREEEPAVDRRTPSHTQRRSEYKVKNDDYNYGEFDKPRASSRNTMSKTGAGHSSKVVDIHTTAKLQVVLTKPEKFSDAREIADNLNEKRTIVLNLESTNKDEALRLLDFLSGVAYANDGEIKKIAKSTFIITPYNVDVMGDLLYELESNGVFFV
ncbi:MAG: cell division protein SepF [Clostridiales bacterium]|nr:cell division protein SepF [Clostridiales bacterium]